MEKISRRSFLLQTAGVGAAVASRPLTKLADKLIPYVDPSYPGQPGEWLVYTTTCRECPAGCGMQVWHRDGRVTKAEGNPLHPVSRGGLCARGQSCVQGLYDPDRLKGVLCRSRFGRLEPSEWPAAMARIAAELKAPGRRISILSDLQTGSLPQTMRSFCAAFGSDRLLLYEPLHSAPLCAAHDIVFGIGSVPEYRIDNAGFILSLSADFLDGGSSPVGLARQFATMHSYRESGIGRMAYIGPRLSMTAANADQFIQLPPGGEHRVAVAMLRVILDKGWGRGDTAPIRPLVDALASGTLPAPELSPELVESLARQFVHSPASIALAGPLGASGAAATRTAVAAALLNWAAGRIGHTVDFSRPHALSRAAAPEELARFVSDLGPDDILVIHNANPVYNAPALAGSIRKAGTIVYLGTMEDETARLADWVLPIDSPLESWGDYEPSAGIECLIQPTLRRLNDTMNAGDVLLRLGETAGHALQPPGAGGPAGDFEHRVRERWRAARQAESAAAPPSTAWDEALRMGGAWKEPPPVTVALRPEAGDLIRALPGGKAEPESKATARLWLWPSVMLYDGRVANRGWLQEAPDPTSSLVWGSWIDVHPERAAALGVHDGDVVELRNAGGRIEAPVRVTGDVAPSAVALAFGQGHAALGRHAAGCGANAFALLHPDAPDDAFGAVTVRKTGEHRPPVSTAPTQDQSGREILQWVALSRLRTMAPGDGDPLNLPLPEGYDRKSDLYVGRRYPQHRWAMVIDLQRCTGCGACGVACYAENNLLVMGAGEVAKGREMAWLKVAPYRKEPASQQLGWIPMLCQQCDAAPCEPVCPVFASVHTEEGLNAQVYNRCVGTRYCSHNCPYKVRRFNWLNVDWAKPLDLQLNPDVTVRRRGVMEKCTFCVQRIQRAERRALCQKRPVRDGEIQPACVQSCPTRALVFGDLLDPQAEVTALTRTEPRRYHVLEELNVKPAVTYLRRIAADERG